MPFIRKPTRPTGAAPALNLAQLENALAEGTDDVDAQVRVSVVEEILEVLTRAAIGRELRDRDRRGTTYAGGMPVPCPREEVRKRPVVTERRETGDRRRCDDVGP